ncbi:hypothetical protein C7S20_03050 [Christiangramia fulva]|uniref:Competence protein n=1 Tax=Christiangramia fulva TaxID=2126553 RepID=A0A2R3Z244_9FLAO|nr:ComEC/Rec2 family competence protein [Christiangramia fulva]AVR44316.1 hypothetical protein C7S20_03050 [Christiangramia fulva]
MKSFRFIFLRLCLYLISGLLAGFYTAATNTFSFCLTGFGLVSFAAVYFYTRKQLFYGSLPGIAAFLLIFSIGFSSAHFSKPENQQNHYLRYEDEGNSPLLKAQVTEILKSTGFSRRYVLESEELVFENSVKKVSGRILLNLTDSLPARTLEPGTYLLLPFEPQKIKPPLNPFQFSYKDYLRRMRIERQLNLSGSQLKILPQPSFSILRPAGKIRHSIMSSLERSSFSASELAIFEALLLGERRNISNVMYKDYAAAGAIHILAISGLHIGILLWLFNFILKPMEKFRYGKIIKTIVLIILLWFFAMLTGLSPSVVRAVSMFSFIAVGMQLNRKTSTLNSIFVSLFFLLLINPFYLFQVGFQLSYLAVTAIVIFYPFIYKTIEIRNQWVDYFWKLTAVSLSAQIGIFPLSLFYFHQFPGLFLLTNLFILPLLAIILGVGLLVIVLAIFNILPDFLAEGFSQLLSLMNRFVKTIAGYENLVFSDLRFSLFQMLVYFVVLIAFLFLLHRRTFKNLVFLLTAILIFQVISIVGIKMIPSEELIVFQKSGTSVIAKKENENLVVFGAQKPEGILLKDYLRERRIKNLKFEDPFSIIEVSGKTVLSLDSSGIYNIPGFSPEILILKDSPKINLDRLISTVHPEKIIADASNAPWLLKKWKTSCRDKKIPFHYTGEKGAYILKNP